MGFPDLNEDEEVRKEIDKHYTIFREKL